MKKFVLSFLFWFSFVNLSIAKVNIQFGESLNYSNYPNLSLKIKATKDNLPISLDVSQILILEDIYPLVPSYLSKPDSEGFQLLSWTSTAPTESLPKFFITVDDETAYSTPNSIVPHPRYERPASYVKFVDNDRNLLKEIRFGYVPVGSYTNQRINIVSAIEKFGGSTYFPTRLDWIGTTSQEFKYLWLGTTVNTNPPPVNLISPLLYSIEVLYIPEDNNYKREYLTVSYDGGRQSHIALVANKFKIPKRPTVRILQPSTNETLYPCQNYLLKWNGGKSDASFLLEYTTNKGKNWEEISRIVGSSFLWSVPNLESDSVYIKISQEFSPPSEVSISTKARQPQKLAFSSDGKKIISASKDGYLTVIELSTRNEINTLRFANLSFPLEKAEVTSLSFFRNDSFAVVSYRWNDFYDTAKNDTLVVLDLISKKPHAGLYLNDDKKLKKFVLDHKRNTLIAFYENDNTLDIYALPELTLQQKISFQAPIQSISLRNNLIAVALLSNRIELFNLDDLTKSKTIEIKYQPIITNIAISHDERYIAYTTKKEFIKDVSENLSDAYVVDIQTGMIVRSLYNNWSDAIGIDFSPNDNHIILGFENNPSIIIWDIVNDVKLAEIFGSGYNITDFNVSPANFTLASAEPSRSLITLREFIYPETIVAGPFKIHKPKLQIKHITLPPNKIFYQSKYELPNNICNIGDVPLKIDYAYFVNGKNFSLENDIGKDSLEVGFCLSLRIIYNPKDTGTIYDTLVIVSCGEKYYVPISGKGLNRNFKFLSEILDFGSVCVNEEQDYEIELGYNDDTLDLPINIVRIQPNGTKHFTIIEGNQYQVLSSKQKLTVKIRFHPREIGRFNTYLEIFYLGQWDYVFRIPIRGEGFGTELSTSTNDLRFIQEIPTREITLKNLSAVDVTIDSIVFIPPNYILVNPSVPFSLQAKSGKILSFTMVETPPSDVQATFYASPCAAHTTVTMGNYSGTSTISLPQIETSPKGTVTIPIKFKNTENKPYNGKRFFEAEFLLNKRMFLPLSIESEFGNARITKQEILGDSRIIGIRVEGDFPQEGILAKITGNVGLGETDTTSIDFNTQSIFWGKNVSVKYLPGSLRLVDLCGNRRIIVEDGQIKNLNISPNPANETINASLETQFSGQLYIAIFDVVGNLHYSEHYYIEKGSWSKTINISSLPNGFYRLVVRIGEISSSIEFIVFKP